MDSFELSDNIRELESKSMQISEQLSVLNQHLLFHKRFEGCDPTIAILFGITGYKDQLFTNIEDPELLKAAKFEAYQRLRQYLTIQGMHTECAPKACEWLFSYLPFPINLGVLTTEQQTQILTQLKKKIRNETGVILFDLMWQNQNGIDELDLNKYNYLFERHRALSFLGIQDQITC
ncbi:hypothetical protein [Paenibacillus sp. FSL L8-0696]|uniref:hypothetical protein n=1 Tax=unclassified Paenibacillus TaxID=185978 RepID=UPI003119D5F0